MALRGARWFLLEELLKEKLSSYFYWRMGCLSQIQSSTKWSAIGEVVRLSTPSTSSYGFRLLLKLFTQAFPEIFSSRNFQVSFREHPERAGSFRYLLRPQAYTQLQESLGFGSLDFLNNLCCEDNETIARQELLNCVRDWEFGSLHVVALQAYQQLASVNDAVGRQAARCYQVACGGGYFSERLAYNFRQFPKHQSMALVGGLGAGMIVGTAARYLALRGLSGVGSSCWSATKMSGQILAKSLAFGLEVPAVVVADQALRLGPQNWSVQHVWQSSLQMGLNLLLIKGALRGAQGLSTGKILNQVLGRTSDLTQSFWQASALTTGVYLGPFAQDFCFGGHTTFGQGRTIVDAAFGALSFSLATQLTWVLTPSPVTSALQTLNLQSQLRMKGFFRNFRRSLAVFWETPLKAQWNQAPLGRQWANQMVGTGGGEGGSRSGRGGKKPKVGRRRRIVGGVKEIIRPEVIKRDPRAEPPNFAIKPRTPEEPAPPEAQDSSVVEQISSRTKIQQDLRREFEGEIPNPPRIELPPLNPRSREASGPSPIAGVASVLGDPNLASLLSPGSTAEVPAAERAHRAPQPSQTLVLRPYRAPEILEQTAFFTERANEYQKALTDLIHLRDVFNDSLRLKTGKAPNPLVAWNATVISLETALKPAIDSSPFPLQFGRGGDFDRIQFHIFQLETPLRELSRLSGKLLQVVTSTEPSKQAITETIMEFSVRRTQILHQLHELKGIL